MILLKKINEPLTNECRYQVMPDASIRLNPDTDIIVLSDVQSAVKLLKDKVHGRLKVCWRKSNDTVL